VEQNALKTALLLNAVDPSIGGVLIQGHKGTGKSTAQERWLSFSLTSRYWEDCPFNSDPRNPLNLDGIELAGSGQNSGQAVLRPMPFVSFP